MYVAEVARQIETPHPPDAIMRRSCVDREEKRVTYGNGLRKEEQLDTNNPNQRDLSDHHRLAAIEIERRTGNESCFIRS